MLKVQVLLMSMFFIGCKTTTYYVVRHAEKQTTNTMTSDVPLSEAGQQRATVLGKQLKNADLRYIYSTNFLRTKGTVLPLSEATGIQIRIYDHVDSLVKVLKHEHGNVLIVGHSNTVDDIVNGLAGKTYLNGDLPDTAYGDLFEVHVKGKRVWYSKGRF